MSIQQDARALHEAGWLDRYFVPFGVRRGGSSLKIAEGIQRATGLPLARELARRVVSEIPGSYVRTFPPYDVLRTVIARSGANPRMAEALLVRSVIAFDRHVARSLGDCDAVFAYNMGALETFKAAKKRGVYCIYGVRSFHQSFDSQIEQMERVLHPALGEAPWADFAAAITERRQAEWELADAVILNSNVARESFRSFGLDLSKTTVIPMAFPPIGPASPSEAPVHGQTLKVLWAGSFSLRKGAHHLLEALKQLEGAVNIQVQVFGSMELPKSAVAGVENLIVRPTIPRAQLFEQYREADVLVLPTLSDGFPMVIPEAMSQGLPVITTANAGSSEVISPGENGFVLAVGDIEALARTLRWCALNRPGLGAMRAKARQAASAWQGEDYRVALTRSLRPLLQERGLL